MIEERHYNAIRKTTINEIKKLITTIKPNKNPGFDLISGKIIKELPIKAVRFITIIFNAIFRLHYLPITWKLDEIIMLLKHNKNIHKPFSYRLISLLPIFSKMLKRILDTRIKETISSKHLIPDHQFGFREKHATTEQAHGIINKINTALESKKYYTCLLLV